VERERERERGRLLTVIQLDVQSTVSLTYGATVEVAEKH
jgi:hypothetical protein